MNSNDLLIPLSMITQKLLLLVALLLPQTAFAATAPIHFNMPNTYITGQAVEISITNTSAQTINIPETGNCHQFFSIHNSSGQPVVFTDPNQICTQDFRTLSLAPQESKILGSWNQRYYVPCPPNANCLVSTLPVPTGAYSIRVLVENHAYAEHPIRLTSTTPTVFSDVAVSHWAYSYIQGLYSKGIVHGYGNGQFGPDNGITRAEVLKMALKSANFKNLSSTQQPTSDCSMEDVAADRCGSMLAPSLPYLDVPLTHSLYPYIYEAYSRGIIPSSTYFYPDQKATRIDCLRYIFDAFDQPTTPVPVDAPQTFSDVSNQEERAYTDNAAANGIVSGSNGKFFPSQSVTRGEISKILANMID